MAVKRYRSWSTAGPEPATRGEYYGLYPRYTLGTIADRNHTVVHDRSGLRPLS